MLSLANNMSKAKREIDRGNQMSLGVVHFCPVILYKMGLQSKCEVADGWKRERFVRPRPVPVLPRPALPGPAQPRPSPAWLGDRCPPVGWGVEGHPEGVRRGPSPAPALGVVVVGKAPLPFPRCAARPFGAGRRPGPTPTPPLLGGGGWVGGGHLPAPRAGLGGGGRGQQLRRKASRRMKKKTAGLRLRRGVPWARR